MYLLFFTLLILTGTDHLWGEEAAPMHWSFDRQDSQGFISQSGAAAFNLLRQAEQVNGVSGKAVRLSRLDALRYEDARDVVGDGTFSIQFWIKLEWTSQRYRHGDVLNFITQSEEHPWIWRVGFQQVTQRQLPRGALPLILRLGEEFTTDQQPVLIEPWQWTHVAFVGTGSGVEIYRNGGFLGTLNYGEQGLPAPAHTVGTLQVNGSLNYDVITDKVGLDRASLRTGVWENDMRFDELIIADNPVRPEIRFPTALRTPPAVGKLENELNNLQIDPRDRFVIAALIRQARQIDNGADTQELRAALIERIGAALQSVRQGHSALHSQRGHIKLSYWSNVDQSEQFYEVYVPNSWQGNSPVPLVVALHGGGEDETVLFERYTLEERAEEKGWIVVCPYGRGQVGYRAAGQQDILDVVAQVQHQWPINTKRIYGVGHSMGAAGTLRLASDKPDFYAAVAPIASPWNPDALEALRELPTYWIIGDKDFLFPRMKPQLAAIEAFVKRTGAPHITQVLAGYDHGGFLDFDFPTVVEVSLPSIFDFFAKHHR